MKMHRVLATLVAMSILAAMPMTVHASDDAGNQNNENQNIEKQDLGRQEANKGATAVFDANIVNSESTYPALYLSSDSTAEVHGDVINKDAVNPGPAIAAYDYSTPCNLTVDGIVQSTGTGIYADRLNGKINNEEKKDTAVEAQDTGIHLGGQSNLEVNGDVSGKSGAYVGGGSTLTVHGDVTGKEKGIVISGKGNTVTVDGTVKGNTSLLFQGEDPCASSENNTITVWKLDSDISGDSFDGSRIHYTVHVTQTDGITITLNKTSAPTGETVIATATKPGYRWVSGTLGGKNVNIFGGQNGNLGFTINKLGGAEIWLNDDITWEEVQEIINNPEKLEEVIEKHIEEMPESQPVSKDVPRETSKNDQVTQHGTDAAEIPAGGGQATITVGGNQIDINTANVKTEAPAKAFVSAPPTTDQIGQNLTTFAQTLQAGQCLSMTKYQLFVGGKPLEGKVGTIAVQMHVTSAQEGQEVLVVIWGPDGGIRYEKVKVVNGVVPVELSEYSYVAVYTLQ